MLSAKGSRIVQLDSAMQDESLIWGGGENGSEDGVILVNEEIVLKRSKAKPLQGRIVHVLEMVADEEVELEEIWAIWSDSVLSRLRYHPQSHHHSNQYHQYQRRAVFYRLDGISHACDFVVLAHQALLPEVTGWRRPIRQIIVCGSAPGLATFNVNSPTLDENSPNGKGLLAVAAATALTSVVSSFARKWFQTASLEDGDDQNEEHENNLLLFPHIHFDDGREFASLAVGKRFCASADTLGRIFIFHPGTLQITRILKGYRSPQMAFQSLDLKNEEELLLLLAPLSRGNRLELWKTTGGNDNGDRPFAFAKPPSSSSSSGVQLAVSSSGRQCAVYNDNELTLQVNLRGDFDANDLEWDSYFLQLKSAETPIDIPIPEGMLGDKSGLAIRRFRAMEESSSSFTLGVDFYLNFLKQTTTTSLKTQHMITRLQMFKTFMSKIQSKIPSYREFVDEFDVRSARRWALEVNTTTTSATTETPSEKLALFCLQNDEPTNEKPSLLSATANQRKSVLLNQPSAAILDVLFYNLLFGDVFVVREMEQALVGIDEKVVAARFVQWWLENRVEVSPAWKHHNFASNSLLKFASGLKLDGQVLRELAKGKAQLARAALLCAGVVLFEKETKQEWMELQKEFERAFKVCVQLFDDDDAELSSFGLSKIADEKYLRLTMARTYVVTVTSQRRSLVVEEVVDENETLLNHCWKRSTDPLRTLLSKQLLGDILFSNAEKRDAFRVEVALSALKKGDFVFCRHVVEELEIPEDATKEITNEALKLLKEHAGNELYIRLLSALPTKQMSLIHAFVLARELSFPKANAFVEATKMERDGELSEATQHLLTELFEMKLVQSAEKEDDETLRGVARQIGLQSLDIVCKDMCLHHYTTGRDQRGHESFDKIVDQEIRLIAALEAFKICKSRLALFLKSARQNKDLAPLLASISPKTTAWLLASSSSTTPVVASASSVPLRSTLAVLNRIQSSLPGPVEGSTAVSPHERCTQLQAFTEGFLD